MNVCFIWNLVWVLRDSTIGLVGFMYHMIKKNSKVWPKKKEKRRLTKVNESPSTTSIYNFCRISYIYFTIILYLNFIYLEFKK